MNYPQLTSRIEGSSPRSASQVGTVAISSVILGVAHGERRVMQGTGKGPRRLMVLGRYKNQRTLADHKRLPEEPFTKISVRVSSGHQGGSVDEPRMGRG